MSKQGLFQNLAFYGGQKPPRQGVCQCEIIEEVKTKPCGEAEIFYTSYEPDNPIQKLYHIVGFEETVQVSPGGENIAIMKI